jgi:hypothetical protein
MMGARLRRSLQAGRAADFFTIYIGGFMQFSGESCVVSRVQVRALTNGRMVVNGLLRFPCAEGASIVASFSLFYPSADVIPEPLAAAQASNGTLRAIASGRLYNRSWEDSSGDRRYMLTVDLDQLRIIDPLSVVVA